MFVHLRDMTPLKTHLNNSQDRHHILALIVNYHIYTNSCFFAKSKFIFLKKEKNLPS